MSQRQQKVNIKHSVALILNMTTYLSYSLFPVVRLLYNYVFLLFIDVALFASTSILFYFSSSLSVLPSRHFYFICETFLIIFYVFLLHFLLFNIRDRKKEKEKKAVSKGCFFSVAIDITLNYQDSLGNVYSQDDKKKLNQVQYEILYI